MRSPMTHLTSVFSLVLVVLVVLVVVATGAALTGCGSSRQGSGASGADDTAGARAATPGDAVQDDQERERASAREAAPESDTLAPTDNAEPSAPGVAAATPPERASAAWAELLSRYVTADGGFRYAALKDAQADRALLATAVQALADTRLSDLPGREAQLAFYLNAYNILTVNAVVTRFPIDSVMSVPGFFDAIEHQVMDASMTLNALENDVIRGHFNEPRIHFAVNCASTGCPWLDGAPLTASNLEASLDRLSRAFVTRTTSVDSRRRRLVVSQLFEWFAGDFEPVGGVRAFLVAHTDNETARAALADERNRVTFFAYDWALNAR